MSRLTRAVTITFAILAAVPAAATTLPMVAPGDPFDGSLTLNPNTPLSSGASQPPFSFFWEDPGNIAVTLGGEIFAAPIFFASHALPPIFDVARWQTVNNFNPANAGGGRSTMTRRRGSKLA